MKLFVDGANRVGSSFAYYITRLAPAKINFCNKHCLQSESI